MKTIYNHIVSPLSDLDREIVECITEGGNWEDIDQEVIEKSKRLKNIQEQGGRTTYYGRLDRDEPSYTINTYFNRVGNGTFIHPEQDRLISQREAARLQSFPDDFEFKGTKTSIYNQIGNAVPVLLARAIGEKLDAKKAIDLFAGAGGLSRGIEMTNTEVIGAVEKEEYYCETHDNNLGAETLQRDLTEPGVVEEVAEKFSDADMVMGGPPCQGFSMAGNWENDDPRDNLFKPFLQVVNKINPEIVLVENVRGIMWKKDGAAVEEIKKFLNDNGYHVNHFVLKAEEYGVPQRRRRVFIIGSKKEEIKAPTPLFNDRGNNLSFSPSSEEGMFLPEPVSVWEAISDLPEEEAGGGSREMERDIEPESSYQELMAGNITFEEFYKLKSKN